MSRRASLPGASELFRRTVEAQPESASSGRGESSHPTRLASRTAAPRRGSGRQKHDAKITVYVSGDELLALEQARLTLRASHDLVVDRGRVVREAVAVVLADFEEHGDESVLVRRLRGDGADRAESARPAEGAGPGEGAASR
ncbi:cobyrinic acid a,c-diamide synthase [Saccharomonospora azurea]|uniref:Cobyrinic acid a,c-diamide synthase n=1 Tax=Saccharomonospora azurea NA-128 TaxID=882081 RepID=H8G5F2_9PSEU|nr:hypothetical protein [Saccharomonospora azurea]EHK86644.1 hypothetical protein SZMC14600_14055 [Saccharomonospora azurea SZMC 14600]EHY88188.1 hypothetical protein SacazDRAFT_01252 [Saccharomonospora azurea NA-128]